MEKSLKKQFNVNRAYKKYLDDIGMNEDEVHIVQKTETKRAFMTGFSYALSLLVEGIKNRDIDESVEIVLYVRNQLHKYFIEQKEKDRNFDPNSYDEGKATMFLDNILEDKIVSNEELNKILNNN